MGAALGLAAVPCVWGCGADDVAPPPPVVPPACAVGDVVLGDGGCVPPGVPPDSCGDGFVSDGDAGCSPVLPAAACTDGTTATVGDESCRPIADCGEARYPATTGPTIYVDATAVGGDGSEAAPFASLAQAVAAAPAGATIAIAAGDYDEAITLGDTPLELAGRCPSMVRLHTSADAAVSISGAASITVRGMTLSGSGAGVEVVSGHALLRDLHLVDLGSFGVVAVTQGRDASVAIDNVRIERTVDVGVLVLGAEANIDHSVISQVAPTPSGQFGRGIDVEYFSGRRGVLSVTGSVVEQVRQHGIYISGSDANIDRVLVRDVAFGSSVDAGHGIHARRHDAGEPSATIVRHSMVERVVDTAIYARAGSIEVAQCTLRDVLGAPGNGVGYGLSLQGDEAGPAPASVVQTKVERAQSVGIATFGAATTLASVLVQDTLADPVLGFGRGASVQAAEVGTIPTLSISDSRFQRLADSALSVFDTHAVLVNVAIDQVLPGGHGDYGDGADVYNGFGSIAPSAITLERCAISNTSRAGVGNFAAHVVLVDTTLECNPVDLNGEHLDGTFTFDDQGGNLCGCGDGGSACQVLSTAITPPTPTAPQP